MARLSKEQIEKKQHAQRVSKHLKEHYRNINFSLHNDRDKEIIEYLDSKPNKKQYIISLILKDMEKENK